MKKLIYGLALLAPTLAMAQVGGTSNNGDLTTFLEKIAGWINLAMPIIIGLALLVFLWGVLQFILAAGDEEKREEGKKKMIYGIIGLFVMVAVWGLVSFVASTLGIDTGGSVGSGDIPSVDLNN